MESNQHRPSKKAIKREFASQLIEWVIEQVTEIHVEPHADEGDGETNRVVGYREIMSQVIDRESETQVIDRESESQVIDRESESRAIGRNIESQVIDKEIESQVIDRKIE